METLTLSLLSDALAGKYAAIRRVTQLQPIGEKVFPPTYEGGEYASEDRVVHRPDGSIQQIPTVLLDSVQSQANRLEAALLRAYDAGRIRFPLTNVNFAAAGGDAILQGIGRITTLEAPHRICDAIFRDAILDGVEFRKSKKGSLLNSACAANATPLLELCPTALLFGFWDSTGPLGGLGAKLQRALVSEIVGYGIVDGKRASSRIDPLQIENNTDIFKKTGGGWTMDGALAIKDKKGEPSKLRPSEVNHGNITPSFRNKEGKLNHGGVTLEFAEQQTVLSLAALRRLRFPVNSQNKAETNLAGQTLTAALGLAAICLLDDDGFDLRSRCLLDGPPGTFEFVGRGVTQPFILDSESALQLLAGSAASAVQSGLPWPDQPVELIPSDSLAKLVMESRRRSMSEVDENA